MSERRAVEHRTERVRKLLFAVTTAVSLFAVLVWAYRDSFRHAPKRDQIYYLIETCRSQSFGEILGKSWSYNRTRTVQPGDTQLYRPGLFLLLAVQSYFFDYHYEYFRLVSLVIHAVVAGLLFRLLCQLAKPYRAALGQGPWSSAALPLGFALLFAFSCTIYDTVSWEHIQGYMVFVGLVLLGLVLFLNFERRETSSAAALLGTWFAFLTAAFFHEAGVVFAPMVGVFAAMAGRWRHHWAWKRCAVVFVCFAAISVIYLAASFLDYRLHMGRLISEDFSDDLVLGTSWSGTIFNHLRFVIYCCIQPLFPFLLKTESGSTIGIRDFFFTNPRFPESSLLYQGLLIPISLCVLFLVGVSVVRSIQRKEFFPLVVLSLLGAFVSIYVLLRLNVRTQFSYSFLGINTQYVYICLPLTLCLVVPAVLEFVSASFAAGARRWTRWLTAYAFAMAALGVAQTWNCNRATAKASAEIWDMFIVPGAKALDELKAAGKSGVQFVFENPEDFATYSQFGVPISTILFGRHEVAENPSALIALPSGKILPPDGRTIPWYVEMLPFDLTTVRKHGLKMEFHSNYAIYRNGRDWIGILCSYPLATLDRAMEFPFTVVAPSRDEFVRRSGENSRLARREAQDGRLLLGIPSQPLIFEERRGWTLMRDSDGYLAVRGTGLGGKDIWNLMSVPNSVLKADSEADLQAQVDAQEGQPR